MYFPRVPQANIQPDKFYTVKGVQLLPLGKVRDSEGREHDFTDDRLAGIAQRYKPTVGGHEARVSIDHAKKGRAHARVPEVYHVPGEGLFGNYADVPGSSAKDFVYYGGFPFRSPELIDFNGGEYVGTITHLGAQRPACKGMRSILPDQIVEQDSPGSEMGEVESGGVWLFSEEPPTIKLQENDMAETEMAEKLGQTTAELAEQTKARELAEAKAEQTAKEFAEYKAAQTREIKLGEAKGKALEFAESAEIKPKLGAVKGDRVAAAIAHGSLSCPQIDFDGKSIDFGEFVQNIIAEMPDGSAPAGRISLGGGKPKGDDGSGATVQFSERTLARIEEKRTELGEDSKEFKAYYAAAEKAQIDLTEGAK